MRRRAWRTRSGISGKSILLTANAPNFGSMFVILEAIRQAREPELRADAIMARLLRQSTKQIPDAQVSVFGAPPVAGHRHGRRFQADGRGPRRPRARTLAASRPTPRSSKRRAPSRA